MERCYKALPQRSGTEVLILLLLDNAGGRILDAGGQDSNQRHLPVTRLEPFGFLMRGAGFEPANR